VFDGRCWQVYAQYRRWCTGARVNPLRVRKTIHCSKRYMGPQRDSKLIPLAEDKNSG